MMRNYGRSDARRDFASARSRSVDAAWREEDSPPCEQTEMEERVSADLLELLTESVAQVSGRYLDPECRFLKHPAHHVCHDREGQPLRRFGTCAAEAAAQVQEQGAVLHAAERAAG